MAASTTDQPSTAPPYADVLSPNRAPALNATSDLPPREPVAVIDVNGPQAGEESGTVDKPAKPDKTDGTSGDKTGGEADDQPQPEGEGVGEEKDKTSPQQRAIITRERNRRQTAEREAAELKAQLKQALDGIAKLTTPEPKEVTRPVREKFDTPDAYDRALEEWAAASATEKAKAEAKAEQARETQAREVKALTDTFTERKAAFEADHPDFDDLVYADDVQISFPMSQAILEAEDGPAIAYYLGQNPEAAERISKLRPLQAIAELGRISARLANPPKPKPEPIRPLANRNSTGPKDPGEMSMEEYAAYRAKKAN